MQLNNTIKSGITFEEIESAKNTLFLPDKQSKRHLIPEILRRRLGGATLQSVGNEMGLSLVRIREYERKGLSIILSHKCN